MPPLKLALSIIALPVIPAQMGSVFQMMEVVVVPLTDHVQRLLRLVRLPPPAQITAVTFAAGRVRLVLVVAVVNLVPIPKVELVTLEIV